MRPGWSGENPDRGNYDQPTPPTSADPPWLGRILSQRDDGTPSAKEEVWRIARRRHNHPQHRKPILQPFKKQAALGSLHPRAGNGASKSPSRPGADCPGKGRGGAGSRVYPHVAHPAGATGTGETSSVSSDGHRHWPAARSALAALICCRQNERPLSHSESVSSIASRKSDMFPGIGASS
jgi:hypothetical protein